MTNRENPNWIELMFLYGSLKTKVCFPKFTYRGLWWNCFKWYGALAIGPIMISWREAYHRNPSLTEKARLENESLIFTGSIPLKDLINNDK